MKVVLFRVDASASIGTGHLMRCLTLADGLGQEGFRPIFICRHAAGEMGAYIVARGHEVQWLGNGKEPHHTAQRGDLEQEVADIREILVRLTDKPDWLIVDHYGWDITCEHALRPFIRRILVIDDLADRQHDCDILVDPNRQDDGLRYRALVPEHCRLLLGPRYLMLRPSFYRIRRVLLPRDGRVRRLLFFFGGSDPTNETSKALRALFGMEEPPHADVVIGSANPHHEEVSRLCEHHSGVSLYIQIENMAEIIARADFAIGAGGAALWERCFLGLPSAATVVADNQRESVEAAELAGAIWNLGWHEDVTEATYREVLRRLFTSTPQNLVSMGAKAMELVGSRSDARNEVTAVMAGLDR